MAMIKLSLSDPDTGVGRTFEPSKSNESIAVGVAELITAGCEQKDLMDSIASSLLIPTHPIGEQSM